VTFVEGVDPAELLTYDEWPQGFAYFFAPTGSTPVFDLDDHPSRGSHR
jgi:hypothetical protein